MPIYSMSCRQSPGDAGGLGPSTRDGDAPGLACSPGCLIRRPASTKRTLGNSFLQVESCSTMCEPANRAVLFVGYVNGQLGSPGRYDLVLESAHEPMVS